MRREDFGTIVEIGDVLVSEDVICEFFACDYPVCKGACCIVGDSGAPLEEDEIPALPGEVPLVRALQRIREERMFASAEELRQQLEADREAVIEWKMNQED